MTPWCVLLKLCLPLAPKITFLFFPGRNRCVWMANAVPATPERPTSVFVVLSVVLLKKKVSTVRGKMLDVTVTQSANLISLIEHFSCNICRWLALRIE